VTGPSGEEIYTDEHGRIKVHFHWDRNNGYDQKSSCWVRVSQAVAGSQWGSVAIPRDGEEVMIAYESGLPDRPIVIGRLYNGQYPAPYPLPANKTRSSLKTLSTPNGGGAAKAASPKAPVAPQAPKDDKSGKVSKAAKAKQQKSEAIALASGSAKAVQSDNTALASVVRGPNVVSNAPLPPEQKTAEIECLRPDGSPAKGFPYQAILADGSEKKGTLDANGKASLQGVPKGSVQVTVGETVVASEVVQLRQEMTQIFQAMVAKEKADAKSLADNRSDHNILQDSMEMDFSIKKGIWKGAVGLLTWINDVKDVVHPVNILHRKLLVAWKSYSSDSEEWAATYKKNIEIADHKELVEALGFDPDKVTAEVIAEAYEITGYLFDDEASRTLIKQFAKDFAQAQDRTEWAEFAGGAIFEIVLGAVIVALTGGLGAAAIAAKSTRHVGKLAELGKVLKSWQIS